MEKAADRLLTHWKRQGIELSHPASEDEISRFEDTFNVRLPRDFREYLLTINGIEADAGEVGWFTFWPVRQIEEEAKKIRAQEARTEDGSSHFWFADYFIQSNLFGIHLSNDPAMPNTIVDWSKQVVAHSFSEFVDLYISDPTRLGAGSPSLGQSSAQNCASRVKGSRWAFLSILMGLVSLTSSYLYGRWHWDLVRLGLREVTVNFPTWTLVDAMKWVNIVAAVLAVVGAIRCARLKAPGWMTVLAVLLSTASLPTVFFFT